MNKITKKYVALILGLVLIITGTLTNTAYASTRATSQLGLNIYGISDATRVYNYSGKLQDYYNNSTVKDTYAGQHASINTLECSIYYTCSIAPIHTYVWIDGEWSEEGVNAYFKQIGNSYNEAVYIRYLSPGKHTIDIKVQQYNPRSVVPTLEETEKTLYVTVPAYEDKYIKNSLEKINNGTATIDDYKTVAVNPKKIIDSSNLAELNKKVKGKNLNISNVQSTVYGLLKK